MFKKKDLPLVEYKIDSKSGAFVNCISLVEFPAIESNFIAFSNKKEAFAANDEKMELLGCAMIPDKPIYRNDEESGEYAGTFSSATIREIAQLYAQNGFFNSMNIEHSIIPAESYIFQSYIVDTDKGINPPKNIEAPDGTWIVGVKVQSDDIWSSIRAGKIKGFSVEGIFHLLDTKTTVKLSKLTELDQAFKDLEDLQSIMDIIRSY